MKRRGQKNENLGEVAKNKRNNRITNSKFILNVIAPNEELIETQLPEDFDVPNSNQAQLICPDENKEKKYIISSSSPKIYTALRTVETSSTGIEILSVPTQEPILIEDEPTTEEFLRDIFGESTTGVTIETGAIGIPTAQPTISAVHSSNSSTSVSTSSGSSSLSSDSDSSVSSLSDLSNISLQTAKKQIKKYHYKYLKAEKKNKYLKRKLKTINKKNTFMQYSTDEAGDITYENGVKITKLQDMYLKKIADTEKGDRKFINTLLQIVFGTEELKKCSRTGRSRSGIPSQQLDPGKNEFVQRMFWERIKTYKKAKNRFAIYNQCVNRKIQNTKLTARKLLLADMSKKRDQHLIKQPQNMIAVEKIKSKKNKQAKKDRKQKEKGAKNHDKVNVCNM